MLTYFLLPFNTKHERVERLYDERRAVDLLYLYIAVKWKRSCRMFRWIFIRHAPGRITINSWASDGLGMCNSFFLFFFFRDWRSDYNCFFRWIIPLRLIKGSSSTSTAFSGLTLGWRRFKFIVPLPVFLCHIYQRFNKFLWLWTLTNRELYNL